FIIRSLTSMCQQRVIDFNFSKKSTVKIYASYGSSEILVDSLIVMPPNYMYQKTYQTGFYTIWVDETSLKNVILTPSEKPVISYQDSALTIGNSIENTLQTKIRSLLFDAMERKKNLNDLIVRS